MMDNKTEQLKVFFDDVISWSEVAFGPLSLATEETRRVTQEMWNEESGELIDATTDVDRVDGAIDMFVVASQLVAMNSSNSDNLIMSILTQDAKSFEEYSSETPRTLESSVNFTVATATIKALEKQLNRDLSPCILNVLESNWSKYPTIESLLDTHKDYLNSSGEGEDLFIEDAVIEQECRWIETARDLPLGSVRGYISDYGYDDNTFSWEDGRRVYFRSEEGKGKIVKPSTYVAPNIQALI